MYLVVDVVIKIQIHIFSNKMEWIIIATAWRE